MTDKPQNLIEKWDKKLNTFKFNFLVKSEDIRELLVICKGAMGLREALGQVRQADCSVLSDDIADQALSNFNSLLEGLDNEAINKDKCEDCGVMLRPEQCKKCDGCERWPKPKKDYFTKEENKEFRRDLLEFLDLHMIRDRANWKIRFEDLRKKIPMIQ